MVLRKIILLTSFLTANIAMAQFGMPAMGGRSAAMGGCSTALDDFWSGTQNIVAAVWQPKFAVGIAYRNHYLLEGMGSKSVAASLRIKEGSAWMVHYNHFGNLTYNEQQAEVAYALRLAHRLYAGVGLNYLHSGTSDAYYEPYNRVTFSMALRYYFGERLILGCRVFNPAMVRFKTEEFPNVPMLMSVGLAYNALPEFTATAELEKNLYYKPTVRLGLEYIFEKAFAARMGICTTPTTYTFGAAYCQTNYSIEFAIQVHDVLGVTPQLSTTLRF